MARIVRNAKLDTRSARAENLTQRKAPYWHPVSPGFAMGYRKAPKGGVWLAKLVRPGLLRRETTLGPADDALDPDGVHILTSHKRKGKRLNGRPRLKLPASTSRKSRSPSAKPSLAMKQT
jgi:hypothetical protein